MTNLKLGPLPKAGMTRVTISLPDPLKEELENYAAEHIRGCIAGDEGDIDFA